jgi:hypothetical protein
VTDYEQKLSGEIASGERLLWDGRPRQGLFLRSSDAFLIPFSLFWGGFAVFWEVMAISMLWSGKTDAPPLALRILFPLFGIPFVVIGLYLIFGRFIVDKKQREKTSYGVTDQRIIIRSGLFNRSTKSLSLRTLTDLSISEKSDGFGTITFGPVHQFYAWFGGGCSWPGGGRYSPPCFDTIPEAKRVYEVIRKAQDAAR